MSFVYPVTAWLRRSLTFHLVFLSWVPEDCFVKQTLHVLLGISCPCRHSIYFSSISLCNTTLVLRVVAYYEFPILVLREHKGPHSKIISNTFMTLSIPLIELTKLTFLLMKNTIDTPLAAGAHSLYSKSPCSLMFSPNLL
jgi:hypothetical protein